MNSSDEVRRLTGLVNDVRTNAQAYRELGDFIHTFPQPTPFHSVAAREMSTLAHTQARNLESHAEELAAALRGPQ